MHEIRMDNKAVSTILQKMALLLELKGENPFKVKAYSNAARSIEILEEDLDRMIREGELKEIKRIDTMDIEEMKAFLMSRKRT